MKTLVVPSDALDDEPDAQGWSVVRGVLDPASCESLPEAYEREARYRSRVVMQRHGFGRGEYKYFAYLLPPLVARLRAQLYQLLAPIANAEFDGGELLLTFHARHHLSRRELNRRRDA